MANPLFTLSVKCKRDLLRARQLTSQAAGLLGFNPAEQRCLTAATFDLACQAHAVSGRSTLCLEIADDHLHVICRPATKKRWAENSQRPAELKLSKPLPGAAPVSYEDVPWMLRQLAEQTPLDLFEEMRKINQELLSTLLDLARLQNVAEDKKKKNASSAA